MILAGDIGGTSTRLALFVVAGDGTRLVARGEKTYRSQDHASLDDIVARFMTESRAVVTSAAFGIAGPVRNGQVRTPNLAWLVDGAVLAKKLGLARVGLINDLEANAWGIAALGPKDFVVLNAGAKDAIGNQAVISAGTGLGEAGLFWDGVSHCPFACEGGHTDFAPRTTLEMRVLEHMLGRFDRVSYERVLSGPGIFNIFQALRSFEPASAPDWLDREIASGDPSAAISKAALSGSHELAARTLELFVGLYGAEAGNVALKMMATGGVYIGGGIAPKIIDKLTVPAFMDAFLAKGRMRPLLEAMPVKVILNDKTALLGAGRYAASRLAP